MTDDDILRFDPERAHALPPALSALVLNRPGRWDAAHERAARVETPETNRVHAYLHCKHGDVTNAGYWYRRVGETMRHETLDEEWTALMRRFLPR